MSGRFLELAGARVFACDAAGPPIAGEREATDLIGEAFGADLVAIPRERLGAGFFQLRTRIAGEILQKLTNYRLRVAIVGDITAEVAASDALRDFVGESNRGRQVWFVADLTELRHRLAVREP